MTGDEFLQGIKDTQGLVLVSVDVDEEAVYVRNETQNCVWRIEARAIWEYDWIDFAPVLLCEREVQPIHQMARIVGYYSIVNIAWNKSKLAELEDRHRGNYTLPEEASNA